MIRVVIFVASLSLSIVLAYLSLLPSSLSSRFVLLFAVHWTQGVSLGTRSAIRSAGGGGHDEVKLAGLRGTGLRPR